jgi:hypothetical protein
MSPWIRRTRTYSESKRTFFCRHRIDFLNQLNALLNASGTMNYHSIYAVKIYAYADKEVPIRT